MRVDSVSIEVSVLLAELSHRADRWGNLNGEIHKYTTTRIVLAPQGAIVVVTV